MKTLKTSTKSATCKSATLENMIFPSNTVPTTLLSLVFLLASKGFSDKEIESQVKTLINSGTYTLTGNFAGQKFN